MKHRDFSLLNILESYLFRFKLLLHDLFIDQIDLCVNERQDGSQKAHHCF